MNSKLDKSQVQECSRYCEIVQKWRTVNEGKGRMLVCPREHCQTSDTSPDITHVKAIAQPYTPQCVQYVYYVSLFDLAQTQSDPSTGNKACYNATMLQCYNASREAVDLFVWCVMFPVLLPGLSVTARMTSASLENTHTHTYGIENTHTNIHTKRTHSVNKKAGVKCQPSEA